MKKNQINVVFQLHLFKGIRRMWMVKVFVLLFLLLPIFSFGDSINQMSRVNLNVKNVSVKQLFDVIQKQTHLEFIFNESQLSSLGKITYKTDSEEVDKVLNTIFAKSDFECEFHNNMIIVKRRNDQKQEQTKTLIISGVVKDVKGNPIPGATLLLQGTMIGVSSNEKGEFKMEVPQSDKIIFVVSFVGMKTRTVEYKGEKRLNIVLEENIAEMEEVVVTGIFERKKESFTGSANTYTNKELKAIGSTNILQSLKTLDPAFAIKESNEYGSDPNRLPDVEIRGKSSLLGVRDNLSVDPNQPLFILDGFESSLQAIYNLDINRVQSITILKDAASTAIYGSKAANGVVVVETIRPQPGELRVSYNGMLDIAMPDLTSYNLMNSKEKLEFEKIAGRFNAGWVDADIERQERYNRLANDINRGVDTYWLADPLRIGINHRHSVYIGGGSENFMFNAGGSYNGITGVMKQSNRTTVSGNIDLIYRVNKLQFTNKFSVDNSDYKNPNVDFYYFAMANPFYSKYNEDGIVDKWLEYDRNLGIYSPNPLYNNNLNSFNKNKTTSYVNKFIVEYSPLMTLKVRGKFSLSRTIDKNSRFVSPDHTDYENTDLLKKGEYSSLMQDKNRYEGELTLTYGQAIAEKHQINIVAGGDVYSEKYIREGYQVVGFPAGDFKFPSFSNGYPEGGTPTYQDSKVRAISAFFNTGYSYDNKYLLDASYRMNGSSVFGTSKKYANTWSVGIGWNISNEDFIKNNTELFNLLKLRASIGNPGNQNFTSYMALSTYRYSFNNYNYFGMSSELDVVGNPNLKWQTTLDKNIGFDMTLWNNRLTMNFDYFYKYTDPLLISVNVPSSTGVTVENTNLGNQTTKGVLFSVLYYFIYQTERRFTWNINANLRHTKTKLDGIGNALESLNKYGQTNQTLARYYDGADPDDLWAVKSLGIDPANGRELLQKKDGSFTYDYDNKDEVVIGNLRPKIEGVVGSGLKYKGFTFDIALRYKLGGQLFNSAVFSKVEGIKADSYNYNLDKRALYDRWKKVGDIAKYKDLANSSTSKMSSRFIEDENTMTIESVRLGYEFTNTLISWLKMSSLRFDAYMTDLARFSSVKAERGTYYPFARSVQFSLSLNF